MACKSAILISSPPDVYLTYPLIKVKKLENNDSFVCCVPYTIKSAKPAPIRNNPKYTATDLLLFSSFLPHRKSRQVEVVYSRSIKGF
jgi:hypothetical protein